MSKPSLRDLFLTKYLIIDGPTGTEIQKRDIPDSAWEGIQGCNEILVETAAETIKEIHASFMEAGADLLTTNTFGVMPWVLDEYGLADRAYDLSYKGVAIAKEVADRYTTPEKPRYVMGSLGPGTKLPSLGHIEYDEMYAGYCISARGMIDAGVDVLILETCQDPLQVKCALHACTDTAKELGRDVPIMVSVTIELSGTMLIGTDIQTLYAIMEPFDVLSLGLNCGTGPDQVARHIKALSEVSRKPITVHSNAGLPENRGGQTYYPMGPEEFAKKQTDFAVLRGVTALGGCCGTTPEHIKALAESLAGRTPETPEGKFVPSIASLFQASTLKQDPAPLLIGERSNATGSKAFRELLLAGDLEGVLSVGQKQVRTGAHALDVSVGFAGRDETDDMHSVMGLYAQKIPLPIMPDSTNTQVLEIALKRIGGRAIINSANLEDGIERFDTICQLAKRYGAALVCLTIDETGMAKTKEAKVAVAARMYERATQIHGLRESDITFDVLTFTVGSGDEEYFTAAIETIEAIKALSELYPESGSVLGLSNISFGLDKQARIYLNSVFLHHCVKAGLSSAIVNTAHLLPYAKIDEEHRAVCESLLFNRTNTPEPLFAFIEYFKEQTAAGTRQVDEAYEKLNTEEKIKHLLLDGDKERMIPLLDTAKDEIAPEKIVNEILIDGMKAIGELFATGEMQLPFVLQSAEVMKASVDHLNPCLPKKEGGSSTTIVIGTVKGDVHDVGKNLVDIILTNNGYKVVNIGIKAGIDAFMEALREHDADCIGMSGLLVKSTQVMQENLEEMKKQGITVPILLGGAALNRAFVEEYCKPVYDGEVIYCKDAFDGISAMECIEKNDFTALHKPVVKKQTDSDVDNAKTEIQSADIVMPERIESIPTPPFWGRRVYQVKPWMKELAFEWINHSILFKSRWGYGKKGLKKEEFEALKESEILLHYERIREQLLNEDLFDPVVLYGYFPCRADHESLYIFDPSEGWSDAQSVHTERMEAVLERAVKLFSFPRQTKPPHRALSDFFRHDRHDLLPLTVVSSGQKITTYEQELYDAGKYSEYYLVHGLGVELAEAMAEIIHKQVRIELGMAEQEGQSIRDVKMQGYQGCRYSFGYPACPDLELNRPLFDLLKPEEYGITLSETFQIVPEQSTSALIVTHPEAEYFTL